jgi:glycosyltransferase involved in cell wall biosynthesis
MTRPPDLRTGWRRWLQWLRPRPAAHSPGAGLRAAEAPAAAGGGPGTRVSVVIPALNEAARIAEVVAHALADEATAEVIVVDDGSVDDTAALAQAAGARVITSTMLGKGASMRDGLLAARQAVVVYLDGDLAGLRPALISELARPLFNGEADFVKARFGRGGGRVTELTAKPMLKVFFPELAHLAQPLGGIVAARRELLLPLEFEDGYGVDVGLLIDALLSGARIAEVDIGRIEHDSQPLHDLAAMANEVARVIYVRSREAGRLHIEQISAMYEGQRQATASIEYILARRRGRRRLLLLDMDGTLTPECFVVRLAERCGHAEALASLLELDGGDSAERQRRVAELFRFVHRRQFEGVARELPLRRGVVEWVNQMRREGFLVGVVSHSYFVAAEVMRRRVFADFALAHTLNFRNEVCTGELRTNPAFLPLGGGAGPMDKAHALSRLCQVEAVGSVPFDSVWVVGDSTADMELLRRADRRLVVEPRNPQLRQLADVVVFNDYHELARRMARGRWLAVDADRVHRPSLSAA